MGLPVRIQKETDKLTRDAPPGITAAPTKENPRYFMVTIDGPGGSCYEGGIFHLELFLPQDYPMEPPKVRFLTKIYHPNIDRLGRICLDIIKDKWSPALQVSKVLLSIQSLLAEPNPHDPLDEDVAAAWRANPAVAKKTAGEWTKKYAK